MSPRRACGVLCASILALEGLWAAAEEVAYHEKFDAAVEAAERGRQLVMVVVVAPVKDKEGRDICQMFREGTLGEEQIAKLIRVHFAPFLLDLGAVREGKQVVPAVVQACFKPNEPISVPQAIFLDAKCKEIDRIMGYAPPQSYLGQLRKVVEKAAALVPAKDRREAQRALERGKQAFQGGDYEAALEALNAALGGGPPGDDQEAAKRMLDEIEERASKLYQEGVDLEAKQKLGSAIRAYRQCARSFKGTEAAEKAAARLVEIQKDPEVRKRLSGYMAAKLLAEAQEAIQQKKYAAAAEALDTILRRYSDAEEAAEAKKLREKLEADPEAAARLRDAKAKAEAERYLSLGDSFRRNKMFEKALAEYDKVVAKFPDTSYARAAQARIAEVKRELGQKP